MQNLINIEVKQDAWHWLPSRYSLVEKWVEFLWYCEKGTTIIIIIIIIVIQTYLFGQDSKNLKVNVSYLVPPVTAKIKKEKQIGCLRSHRYN